MCLATFHHCWNHTSNSLLIVEEELVRSFLRHSSWLSGDLNNISSSLKQWQHNYLHHILLRHTHYHKLLLLLWNLLKAVRGANPPPSPPPSSSLSPSSPLKSKACCLDWYSSREQDLFVFFTFYCKALSIHLTVLKAGHQGKSNFLFSPVTRQSEDKEEQKSQCRMLLMKHTFVDPINICSVSHLKLLRPTIAQTCSCGHFFNCQAYSWRDFVWE